MAQLGLPAAICYADIAPAVPHALHMPSHIFTRVGKWPESIGSNSAAATAGQEYAVKVFGAGVAWDQSLHAMDYLEYAYLQQGQDADAKRVLDQLQSFQKATPTTMAAAYAIAAIPVRFALERQDWAAAAALSAPPIVFPWDRFPWTTAMISYGRALGAAHTGDFAAAQAEIGKLQSAKDAAASSKNVYWAGQIDVQMQAASAVLTFAQGREDEALVEMRAAADAQDTADKNNVTPGPVLPAREMLADMLLQARQPAQALAEYERSLDTAPNRFRSLAGAAAAAEQMGNAAKARTYNERLVQLSGSTGTERPEALAAKRSLEKG
jgi:tetratricopeptide (TPR) repeat protein